MSSNGVTELVERVIEVTGVSEAEAQHLLGACANDVGAAVALHFEQGVEIGGDNNSASERSTTAASSSIAAVEYDGDGVRAPIAPRREQLIGPDEDNFFTPAPSTGRLARVTQRVRVCPLRDFAREGAIMEEEMQAAATSSNAAPTLTTTTDGAYMRRHRRARAASMVMNSQTNELQSKAAGDSSARLGDLFRPPTDISYAGTFQTARKRATALKHWLLVNVQSDNFDSQLLNRDVWSDKEVRKLISRQFMLWQINCDSSEGRRFVTFYHCERLPYICVIDPRTGEEIWRSHEPKQSNVLSDLQNFLLEHKDFSQEFDEDEPSTSKRSAECITINDEPHEDGCGTSNNVKKRSKLMELSEEEQIALAIRNSMRENGIKSSASSAHGDDDDGSDCDSVEEFGDDDSKNACERTSYETKLGTANEITTLKLRLINADGAEEMVQLRWPSDTRLEVLRLYISQRHTHVAKQDYKLICAYPRKTLDVDDDKRTLKEMGLHPSANLHITWDD